MALPTLALLNSKGDRHIRWKVLLFDFTVAKDRIKNFTTLELNLRITIKGFLSEILKIDISLPNGLKGF
ncbi:hypothetical protein D3C87_1811800 [compost metagenome]